MLRDGTVFSLGGTESISSVIRSSDFCDPLVIFDLATDLSVLECHATDFFVLESATHQLPSPTNPTFQSETCVQ